MELRRIRYFVAVAELLHFRRAAEQLHLAQPALSQHVRKLELELGVDLFRRSKRAVTLTPAGVVFLDEARRILRQADTAARAVRDVGEGSLGRLRIGHLPGPVPTALLEAITRFAVRHPGVEVVPETVSALRAVDDVQSGRLDAAFVGLPIQAPELRITSLSHEDTIAVVPDRHALSGRPELSLDRIGDTRVIVLPRRDNPAFHDGIVAACRGAGIAPTVIETCESGVDHALLIVAAGGGIALLPASATRYSAPAVRFLPLADPAPTTEMGVVTRMNDASTTVEALLRVATERHRPLRRLPSLPSLAEAPAA
jgi:DNA-binding transcriptional LysR family regulator